MYVAQCSRRQLRMPMRRRSEKETKISTASSAASTPYATEAGAVRRQTRNEQRGRCDVDRPVEHQRDAVQGEHPEAEQGEEAVDVRR